MTSEGSGPRVDIYKTRGEASTTFVREFLNTSMILLDIGCGPGSITSVLARYVGKAIGIDIEPSAIEKARDLTKEKGIANLEFVEGDMRALPYGDASFDAVFVHAVLYHLDAATLQATLREIKRVLKVGGIIAARETDVGGDIVYPDHLSERLNLWMRWYQHADPNAVRFGRRQGTVLRSNGFVPVWSGASFENYSPNAAGRMNTVSYCKANLEDMREDLLKKGLATPHEIEEAFAAWDAWGNDPDGLYLRCRCECVAKVERK